MSRNNATPYKEKLAVAATLAVAFLAIPTSSNAAVPASTIAQAASLQSEGSMLLSSARYTGQGAAYYASKGDKVNAAAAITESKKLSAAAAAKFASAKLLLTSELQGQISSARYTGQAAQYFASKGDTKNAAAAKKSYQEITATIAKIQALLN